MSMHTPPRRATSMLALVLLLPSVSACGGAPSAPVQTGPAPSVADPAEAEARAALEALDDIASARVCITPELCEDLREWRPEHLEVLDGHLIAMGRAHAFVWRDGAWAHHAVPLHGEPTSNGHASFFCDHEGGVFQLTTEGVRRRGTLPSPECAAVVAAGEQLYVVVGDGPILRQDGNAWAPLEHELQYGNGYSVDTVVMTPTRAFLVDERARLLELPSAGPSYEPRFIAETGLGHMATLRAIPGREAIVAIDREIAILDEGSVRRVPLPGREPRPASPEPSTSNDDEGSAGDEEEEYEEEEYEEDGADGIRQISDTEFEMGMWIVGLDPVILARGHVVMTPGTAEGQLTLDHFVLGPAGWSPLAPRTPETFAFAASQGAFGTTLPERTAPVHLGPYRVVVNTYPGHSRGPVVTAWRHDEIDVALTAFAPEQTDAALEARCEGPGVRCAPTRSGSILRQASGPTPTLELLSEDGGQVLLRHEGGADLRVLEVAGRERIYVLSRDGSMGYVDAEGLHPIARPAGSSLRGLHVASDRTAYLVSNDGHVSYFDGSTLALVPHAEAVANEPSWYPLADGVVVCVSGQRPVWIRSLEMRTLELGGAAPPDVATRTSSGDVVLAARDGHSWILRGDDVLEVTAPAPDAAHAGGTIYFLPDDAPDGTWRVTFAHPHSSSGGYRASAPAAARSLGTLESLARAYQATSSADGASE